MGQLGMQSQQQVGPWCTCISALCVSEGTDGAAYSEGQYRSIRLPQRNCTFTMRETSTRCTPLHVAFAPRCLPAPSVAQGDSGSVGVPALVEVSPKQCKGLGWGSLFDLGWGSWIGWGRTYVGPHVILSLPASSPHCLHRTAPRRWPARVCVAGVYIHK